MNLQTTPCDDEADLRINGETDTVMAMLAQELGVNVPPFDIQQFFNECQEAPTRATEPPTVGSAVFDRSSWHAVVPLTDCPHTRCVGKDGSLTVDVSAKCVECGVTGENMLCLQCGAVHCGRHVQASSLIGAACIPNSTHSVQGHAVQHNKQSGHPMICGFADLSFWCYECDQYVCETAPALRPVYHALHLSKFDEPPPGA